MIELTGFVVSKPSKQLIFLPTAIPLPMSRKAVEASLMEYVILKYVAFKGFNLCYQVCVHVYSVTQ